MKLTQEQITLVDSLVIEDMKQMREQVDHVLRTHKENELIYKIFDLTIEWYNKGISTAMRTLREGNNCQPQD